MGLFLLAYEIVTVSYCSHFIFFGLFLFLNVATDLTPLLAFPSGITVGAPVQKTT